MAKDPLDAKTHAATDPLDDVSQINETPPPVATSETVGPDGKVDGRPGYGDAHPDARQAD